MSEVLIRYEYPGTSAKRGEPQQPVGTVYVERASWSRGVHSYTKRAAEATRFGEEEAEREIGRRHWPSAVAVDANSAPDL